MGLHPQKSFSDKEVYWLSHFQSDNDPNELRMEAFNYRKTLSKKLKKTGQ
jgi:hypothetical protein